MFFNILPELKHDLQQVSSEMERLLPEDWSVGAVGDIFRSVMASRGKGIRPSLLLLLGRLGPRYPQCTPRLYRLSALVEFIHMASLIHDDIIDDSTLRRGFPTIQSQFGKDMAVYTGDMILSQILTIILRDGLIESGSLLAKTIQDMCRGEINQAACRYKVSVTQEEYYANIYGKTASMFVSICKIAGIESGCTDDCIEQLGQFGLHLGYLFQIRDDLLDFSMDKTEEAKSLQLDFQEGVLTLPVLFALKSKSYRPELEGLIERARTSLLSASEFQRLHTIIAATNGFGDAVELAESHRSRALELLSALAGEGSETVRMFRLLIARLELPKLHR